MDILELLSALGSPARLGARILFIPRYCLDGFGTLRSWHRNEYAQARFGKSAYWRVWLLFDTKELEALEKLINEGSDEDLLRMRDARLESFRLVALVGALLASVALQALSLPLITSTSFVARGALTASLMLSILATFFTCIQQRELGTVANAMSLRAWLSNGVRYTNSSNDYVFQSSQTALALLESPYEFLSVAIVNFVGGMAAYLGSAWRWEVPLNAPEGPSAEILVIVFFAVTTGFAFLMFPVLLGNKDKESLMVGSVLMHFQRQQPGTIDENWATSGLLVRSKVDSRSLS